jgi:hypothetical protein
MFVQGFRVKIFNYKVMICFLNFFGLGPKLETNQVFQPPTPPCPPNLAWKDKE